MATTMSREPATKPQAASEDRPYTLGSVWMVQLIRVKAGHDLEYTRDLAARDKHLFEELKKEGIILSYKILRGMPASRDDFNTLVLIEYPNYAAFDRVDEFEAARRRVIGTLGQMQDFVQQRAEIREVIGAKDMQEIHLK